MMGRSAAVCQSMCSEKLGFYLQQLNPSLHVEIHPIARFFNPPRLAPLVFDCLSGTAFCSHSLFGDLSFKTFPKTSSEPSIRTWPSREPWPPKSGEGPFFYRCPHAGTQSGASGHFDLAGPGTAGVPGNGGFFWIPPQGTIFVVLQRPSVRHSSTKVP